jgi:hypothetical protein
MQVFTGLAALKEVFAMLAYVFWHRPYAHVDHKAYEDALLRFQSDLAVQPPPGLIAATSFRIEPVPWLSNAAGYEDWYLLEGSWAMDPLNSFAVTGRPQSAHDGVAAQADEGHGGLYAHAGGELAWATQSTLYWLERPRGIQWQAALAPARTKYPQAVIWRRQMLLAPAAEFAVEVPGDVEVETPSDWERVCRVRRTRLVE